MATEEHTFFTPKPGVKIYMDGGHAAHEGGKPIRMPVRTAEALEHLRAEPEEQHVAEPEAQATVPPADEE